MRRDELPLGLLSFRGLMYKSTAKFLLIPVLATILTWLTSLVRVYSMVDASQYGLPFVWKTLVVHSCTGIYGLGLLRFCVPSFTIYQWGLFAFDVLLYTGIGYSAILLNRKRSSSIAFLVIPVLAAWLTWSTAILVPWSGQPGTWTNGFPMPWAGVFYRGWTYNWFGFALDATIFAALQYLAFFLYRGFKISGLLGRRQGPLPSFH